MKEGTFVVCVALVRPEIYFFDEQERAEKFAHHGILKGLPILLGKVVLLEVTEVFSIIWMEKF